MNELNDAERRKIENMPGGDDVGRKKIEEAWASIDDKYILEAAENSVIDGGTITKTAYAAKKSGRSRFRPWIGAGIAAVVVLLVIGIGIVPHVGRKNKNVQIGSLSDGIIDMMLDHKNSDADADNDGHNGSGNNYKALEDSDAHATALPVDQPATERAAITERPDHTGYDIATNRPYEEVSAPTGTAFYDGLFSGDAVNIEKNMYSKVVIYVWKDVDEYKFVIVRAPSPSGSAASLKSVDLTDLFVEPFGEDAVVAYLNLVEDLEGERLDFEVLPVSEFAETFGVVVTVGSQEVFSDRSVTVRGENVSAEELAAISETLERSVR